MISTFRFLTVLRWLVALLLAFGCSAPTFAQDDQGAIQARMKGRIAAVDELKLAGLVGENNKGFLEQRGQLTEEQTKVMNAENSDRRALYTILAGRLGVSAAVVGAQRAATLRQRSAPNVWVQAEDDSWYGR